MHVDLEAEVGMWESYLESGIWGHDHTHGT